MNDELRQKISSEVAETRWDALAPHQLRGALFLVDLSFDLVEVALAVATNQTRVVQAWIAGQHLRRPEPSLVDAWTPTNPSFRFVIVQPFVLAQSLVS